MRSPSTPSVGVAPPPDVSPSVWYYCDAAGAYYPNVSTCPEPWREVAPPEPAPAAAPPPAVPAVPGVGVGIGFGFGRGGGRHWDERR